MILSKGVFHAIIFPKNKKSIFSVFWEKHVHCYGKNKCKGQSRKRMLRDLCREVNILLLSIKQIAVIGLNLDLWYEKCHALSWPALFDMITFLSGEQFADNAFP